MSASPGQAICIFMYHSLDASGSVVSVEPRLFAEQMAALAAAGYRGIPLREAVEHRGRTGAWPERCAVLTFDDGFANVWEHGLPVLRRHGFTATLYAISGHVGGRNDWGPPPRGLGSQTLASWEGLLEWCAAGNEVGAHTRSHPDLRRVPPDAVEAEIVGCRDEIASRLGRPVDSFGYPYGHVSPAAARVVSQSFRTACLTTLRRATVEPPLALPRVDAFYLRAPAATVAVAQGRRDGRLTLRRWARTLRGLLTG